MTVPTQDFRRTALTVPRDVPAGLDTWVDAIVGMGKRRAGVLRRLRHAAQTVDRLAPEFHDLADDALRQKLADYRDAFRRNAPDRGNVRLASLAAIREAAERRTGMRPFLVQLMGALALDDGYLLEMATGEGKTLVASLAAVWAGWSGYPCHVITVNDYLAARDADWLRPLYDFCRVTVGSVTGPMEAADRVQGHSKDITYTTGKEILADFLRDRLRFSTMQDAARRHIRNMLLKRGWEEPQDGVVMRGLHTAIVDEADSILIDEAVTPLIISHRAPNESLREAALAAQRTAATLIPGTDYRIQDRYREVELTEEGRRKAGAVGASLGGIWRAKRRWTELIEQALTAREFFRLDTQYVLQDNSVVIVDEYTGRLMPMRTWRHGLHQAIEAKEGLDVSDASETLSRLSFQRFFRFFSRLSGMTGTASEASRELWHIYRLPVVRIPTNRPCVRRLYRDLVFARAEQKWDAVVAAIKKQHEAGQPILIGTRSVQASDALAQRLTALDLDFNLLNAVQHESEARIVAEAGQARKITIATNMAGRGTDILLGPRVKEVGGLHVLATERHDSRRIDRQLFGRSARQGDPGSAQAFLSLDDELFVRFLPGRRLRQWLQALVSSHCPGAKGMASLAVRYAQMVAQRQTYKQRKGVLKMDTWMDDSLSFTDSSDQIGG